MKATYAAAISSGMGVGESSSLLNVTEQNLVSRVQVLFLVVVVLCCCLMLLLSYVVVVLCCLMLLLSYVVVVVLCCCCCLMLLLSYVVVVVQKFTQIDSIPIHRLLILFSQESLTFISLRSELKS